MRLSEITLIRLGESILPEQESHEHQTQTIRFSFKEISVPVLRSSVLILSWKEEVKRLNMVALDQSVPTLRPVYQLEDYA
ncbi:hypothetical protein RJT34_16465 [Clitoria ternatea]|uniref:Uncharacterized protein n=1 Tax=Clitoria ternatea TaxID=43366 RepID=A0AAN9J764_CLITE